MDIQAEKLQLIQWLAQVKDEEIINRIQDLRINNREQDTRGIIAYAADGQALTEKTYNLRLEKGAEDIRDGRVISQDELEQEVKNW